MTALIVTPGVIDVVLGVRLRIRHPDVHAAIGKTGDLLATALPHLSSRGDIKIDHLAGFEAFDIEVQQYYSVAADIARSLLGCEKTATSDCDCIFTLRTC